MNETQVDLVAFPALVPLQGGAVAADGACPIFDRLGRGVGVEEDGGQQGGTDAGVPGANLRRIGNAGKIADKTTYFMYQWAVTHLIRSLTLVLATCALAFTLSAAEVPDLDPHLEPLRPWLGKTWRGEFKNSTPGKPVVDVSRWERALNGKAVRILHSINDGVYGGESLVVWAEKKQAVAYYYFTTAGFMTTGTMTFKDGKIISHEVVSGSAGGTSEVRATTEMRADGSYHVTAEYLKEGGGTIGRETTCKVDAAATVMFK